MKSQIFGCLIIILAYSNFVLRDVDAGGETFLSCPDMSSFFNMSMNAYNSTIQTYAQELINILETHASVNASQPSFDFNSYANAVFFTYQNKISTATYMFFDALSAFVGSGVSSDDLANIIFGDTLPDYPLNCVLNIHDPFYAYANLDTSLNDLLASIISAHKV
ncbi:unnamed protein product [Chironomus riparius]|uniref:Uncharacterized protein n=1 Tax=Chironomus riparius TaxID=315576 RepID=A0A9N9RP64_9DIPT|nr:unnamed protein product [Chironomus riparius]